MRRFRTTLWGTVAAIAGVAATLALGNWQMERARYKLELAAEQQRLSRQPALQIGPGLGEVGELEMREVEAYGRFEPQAMVLLDNRVRGGIVGYEVIMPLRVTGLPSLVLVNRGWIAGGSDRRSVPEIVTPVKEVRIEGRAVIPGKRIFELGTDTVRDRVWQNLTIERYRERLQLAVLPFVIQQSNDIADGLKREWPAVDRGVDTHRSYAVQWFAIAALIAVVYVVLGFRGDATQP
jgi:surfeit locus 1 family protein